MRPIFYVFFLLFLVSCQSNTYFGHDFRILFKGDNVVTLTSTGSQRIDLSIMTRISSDHAEFIVNEDMAKYDSIFDDSRVGYPGQFTHTVKCPDELKPRYYSKETDKGYLKYFVGYANSNYVAGACSKDLVRYKTIHGILYCTKNQALYEFDYYINITDDENRYLENIKC